MGPLGLPHNHIKVSRLIFFSGMTSDDSDQNTIYEGINLLNIDHRLFYGMKHGDAIISNVSPVSWLRHLFNQYSPTRDYK